MAYNGWKNYETWAVGMYLAGNYDGEGTYRHVLEIASDVVEEIDEATEYSTVDELRQFEVADRLKDFVEESTTLGEPSLASDLLGAALSEVDWHELAEAKLSEIAEQVS